MPTDVELMLQVQRGKRDAFGELVERYRSALTRVARSKISDADAADDIVQETFLAVYASRQTYNPNFAVRTWIWTILLNLCRKYLDRRQKQANRMSKIGALSSPICEDSGLTALLVSERRDEIAALLDELPEAQADALRLRFFGELKFAEIAETMGSSVSGAKVRVRKGLMACAQLVRDRSVLDEESKP
ncbi:RNA polymerase sigma factor [Thalassoroseus pseudoceratinae]|uniref:RNA polymerase sigma factor n=1 Tax=Thalassoroseus pseudoceratinae TaxID=2713176 RepID=UPI00141E2B9A|nr:RNA polymerase sigma factor [Thalassoroseus pseudoceratinae]